VIKATVAPKDKYPLLDEKVLIQALSTEISREEIEKIRGGAVLAVVDAYDRKVPRGLFLDIVATALPMYDWLGSLQTVQRVETISQKRPITPEALAEAVAEYTERSNHARQYLLTRMQGIVACAPSDATIH
jgi:hypothetical protein